MGRVMDKESGSRINEAFQLSVDLPLTLQADCQLKHSSEFKNVGMTKNTKSPGSTGGGAQLDLSQDRSPMLTLRSKSVILEEA